MAILNSEQKEFIRKHKISEDLLFDASGMRRVDYREQMKQEEKYFAYGVTKCEKGHSLRSRSGHCIQCDPAKITYTMRHTDIGWVYIAGSVKGQIIKVGSTKSKSIRAESLNRTVYGSFNDWEILCICNVKNMGKIESAVQSNLYKYRRSFGYKHDSSNHESDETFCCSYSKAFEALKHVKEYDQQDFLSDPVESKFKAENYQFRNLIRSE